VLSQPKTRLPCAQDLVTQTLLLDIYQIKPVTDSLGAGTLQVPVSISAGFGSYPYLRKGFHKWYLNPEGVATRWTDGEAVVMVPWPTVDPRSPVDFCMALDVAGGRPLEEPPVNLVVTIEGVEVFEDQLDRSFAPETLRIPVKAIRNDRSPQLEIQLNSTTWDASKVGDDRALGVLFYGVQLLSLNECSID